MPLLVCFSHTCMNTHAQSQGDRARSDWCSELARGYFGIKMSCCFSCDKVWFGSFHGNAFLFFKGCDSCVIFDMAVLVLHVHQLQYGTNEPTLPPAWTTAGPVGPWWSCGTNNGRQGCVAIYRRSDFCVHSSLPSHKDVSYEQLLGALQRYGSCHQRLGQ